MKHLKSSFIFFLFALFFLREVDVVFEKSITCDETVHIPAGLYYIKKSAYFLNIEHPPFCKLLSGFFLLPLKLDFPEDLFEKYKYNQWALGNHFFIYFKNEIDKILFFAKLPMIFLGLILGFFIYLWTKQLYGEIPSIFSLFLFTFCPNFLAHSNIVHTDVGLSLFLFLTFFYLYQFYKNPSYLNLFLYFLFFGFSLSTKFSSPYILIPVSIILFFYIFKTKPEIKKKFPFFKIFSFLLIPLFFLALTYKFKYFLLYFKAFKEISFQISSQGRLSYLNGKFTLDGWKSYFIFAFFYKTPFAYIFILFLSFFLNKLKKEEIFLILPSFFYFFLSSFSRQQIGVRYILPFYPFLFVFAGRIFNLKGKLVKLTLIFLSLWYAVSSIKIHPDYLAYFNEIAGGPENGWKHLIDSNIDWGQDLKQMRDFLIKERNPELLFSFFSSVDAKVYDIKYQPFLVFFSPITPSLNSSFPQKEYFAISVNNLAGLFYVDHDIFYFFKKRKPDKKIGYSIFVYDLKDIDVRKEIFKLAKNYNLTEEAKREERIITEYYEKNLPFKNNDSEFLTSYSEFFMEKGDIKKAFKYTIKAINIDISNINAYRILGEIYFKRNKLNEAEEILKRIIEINPYDDYLHYLLAGVYYQRGEIYKALHQLEKAYEINSNRIIYVINLAYLYYYDLKDFHRATYYYKKAISIQPSNLFLQNDYAVLLASIGKKEKAIKILKKILLRKPDLEIARKNLEILSNVKGNFPGY